MAISITGTVYSNDGVTHVGSGVTVKCSINGGAATTVITNTSGVYTFSSVSPSIGNVIAIYTSSSQNSLNAIVWQSGNLTAVDLWKNNLLLKGTATSVLAPSSTQMNTVKSLADASITAIISATTTSLCTLAAGIKYNNTFATSTSPSISLSANAIGQAANFTFTGSGSYTYNNTRTPTTFTTSGTCTVTLASVLNTVSTVSIGAATTLDVSSSNFAVNPQGSWSNSGTFVPQAGTVTLLSIATLSGTLNFYNLTLGSGGSSTATLGAALTCAGTLTIVSPATLDVSASNYAVNVAGNWVNGGTFTAQNGTVTLNGTNQTISGSTTFYNLVKTVASADTLTFTDGTTQTVTNALTLQGASGQLLTLAGTSTGGWTISVPATQTLSYLSVSYSTATTTTAAAGSTSTDGGHNTNWTFGGVTIHPWWAYANTMMGSLGNSGPNL